MRGEGACVREAIGDPGLTVGAEAGGAGLAEAVGDGGVLGAPIGGT